MPIPMAVPFKARVVLDRSNAGIKDLNPNKSMNVVCVFDNL
jgi:hypothetical protein